MCSDNVVGIYFTVVVSGRYESVWLRITLLFCVVEVMGLCDVCTLDGVDGVKWNDGTVADDALNG